MPALKKNQAVEKLATAVEKAKPSVLAEIHAELFPEKLAAPLPSATDLAQHIRTGLEAEEIIDLWNVVFPADRNVWYDDEENEIHYNEVVVGYADTD
jgi:hypothetical protein